MFDLVYQDLARNLLTLNELSPVVVDIFGVDHSGPRVRLRSFEERLVALCEWRGQNGRRMP